MFSKLAELKNTKALIGTLIRIVKSNPPSVNKTETALRGSFPDRTQVRQMCLDKKPIPYPCEPRKLVKKYKRPKPEKCEKKQGPAKIRHTCKTKKCGKEKPPVIKGPC